MTLRDSSSGGGVDWDRLADHLGGALSGTPEEAEMARLLATDPGWARAAAEMSAAFDAVRTDLRSLPEPTLPDQVAARLDAAVAATAAGTPATELPGPRTGGRPPGIGGPGADQERRPPGHPRARPRRRMARWGAGLAVAAGAAAFAAIGFAIWGPTTQQFAFDGGSGDDAEEAPGAVAEQPQVDATSFPVIIATGTDYQRPTIEQDQPARGDGSRSGPPALVPNDPTSPFAVPDGDPDGDERVPDIVPPRLSPMWVDPDARQRCLELIRVELGPPPVMIQTVDFARFEGHEALVIWATVADGSTVVWASGPACGTPGAGTDVLYQS